jgi:hypothetical protein
MSGLKIYNCTSKLSKLFLSLGLLIGFLSESMLSMAQNKRNKLDEINITSSFKPSIVKTSKLEFFPEVPQKDTNAFKFLYPAINTTFKTPLSSFSIKPLAYNAKEIIQEKDNFYIKLGGGNLRTPFASAAYNSKIGNNVVSLNFDHISSKGSIYNQQYANTKFEGQVKTTLADNQYLKFNLGYEGDDFRNFGYDTSKFFFQEDEIKQRFNKFNLGAYYDLVSSVDASLSFKPALKLGYLTSRRGAKETAVDLKIPVSYSLEESLRLSASIDLNYLNLRNEQQASTSTFLVQVPLKIDYTTNGLFASGGLISVLKNKKVSFLPEAALIYTFKEGTGARLLAGISNAVNVNSLQKLYEINPFLLTPDSLNVYQQTNYYIGFDWLNPKGLQLQAKTGFVNFKNLPLFINEGLSGKDFLVLNEPSISALFLEAKLGYVFSDKLSFNSALKAFSFQSQNRYEYVYGILPLELTLGLNWKPLKQLSTRVYGELFGGNMAKTVGKPDFRTKGIVDLGLGVDYNLNKKWALWMDLNNIANARYQRWNGFTSFGFNFLVGFKYRFIHTN